jgi:hypothetical protein
MNKIRLLFAALCMSLGLALPASFAQASVSVSIGINVPVYPQLVPVPGYPVYYAPGLPDNYFFYDGLYWVFIGDNWYQSAWYNGPWTVVGPQFVPVYILRVPVRYYRQPPPYFRAWTPSAPPHWGERWGPAWEQQHRGWDHWNRAAAPRPAPLPTYQRQYSGPRYPRDVQQQQNLHSEHYRYQPKEAAVREHVQQQRMQAPREEPGRPEPRRAGPPPRPEERAAPPAQMQPPQHEARGGPREEHPGKGRAEEKGKKDKREEQEK